MSAPFALGYTVRVSRGPMNEHGDIDYAYSHDIEGAAWAPRYSNENNEGRTTVIVGLTLYGPYGADLLSEDRVELPRIAPDGTSLGFPPGATDVDERTYRVVGERGDWRSPFTGWTPGFEAALEKVS